MPVDTVCIEHGQRWKPKGERIDWRVVGLTPDRVGLSGPGPCRGMTYVSVDELLTDWEMVASSGRRR